MWAALTLAAVLAQPAPDASEPQMLPPPAADTAPAPDEPKMLPPDEPLRVVRTGTRRFFPLPLAFSISAPCMRVARNGKAIQLTAAVFAAAGIATGLFGVGLFLFGSEGQAFVSLSPTGFAVAGTF